MACAANASAYCVRRFPPDASDPAVTALAGSSCERFACRRIEVVDPFTIPEFDDHPARPHPASEVRAAIEKYLARTGQGFPKSIADIVASKQFHPLHETGLVAAAVAPLAKRRSRREATGSG